MTSTRKGMTNSDPIELLILSPQCDGYNIGESRTAFDWIERLSTVCNVTLLTLAHPGRVPPSKQLPRTRVIELPAWPFLRRWPRFASRFKPWYPAYYLNAKSWIRQALRNGETFDLMHQLSPLGMRYPSPCTGFGMPYVFGPLAGSLETPTAFLEECEAAPFYTKLRWLDRWRFRHDPWLRRSYGDAATVLCSAPYVRDLLADIPNLRAKILCEVGIETACASMTNRSVKDFSAQDSDSALRLLYVGRVVRTKGLRDAVRAIAKLKGLPQVTLTVVGAGEDLPACRTEAEALGVADRVQFLGACPHDEVMGLYESADAFIFPSFREATGIVLFEAMSRGLPIITSDRGGPGHIVDDASGFRVPVETPAQFAEDLAKAIRTLAGDRALLGRMGAAAARRVEEIGAWPNKIEAMLEIYRDVLARNGKRPQG